MIPRSALAALFCVTAAATSSAAPYKVWCSNGYLPKQAVMVVNKIGSVSVLYVEGDKPRALMYKYQAVLGNSDPDDLRARDVWIVEDRLFRLCKDQKLPAFVHLTGKLPDKIDSGEDEAPF